MDIVPFREVHPHPFGDITPHEDVPTEWNRDDYASQTGLFAAVAAVIDDVGRQATFPTRLEVAALQARMLFGAIESARAGRRILFD